MAKFPADKFAAAAAEFNRVHGTESFSKDETGKIRDAAKALAEKLGKDHPAYEGLMRVVNLRASIARRFITIALRPYRPVEAKVEAEETASPAPEPKATKDAKAAQSASRKASRGQQPVASA